MKTVVMPLVLAAVVAAAVSALMLRAGYGGPAPSGAAANGRATGPSADALRTLLAGYKKNPDTTTIVLFKDGVCKAEVGSDPIGNYPERRVFWHVLNDTERPCELKEPHPKIKLVFEPNENGRYPFAQKDANSRRHGDLVYVYEKIKKLGSGPNDAEVDLYKYSVYLLNGTDTDPEKPIFDPDLEIEDPNFRNTNQPAADTSSPPSGNTTPAKKGAR
jgi:hypothetical protein